MNKSEDLTELAKALSSAQKVMANPLTDQSNPFFKSQFLSLAALMDAVRPIAEYGLSYTQIVGRSSDGVYNLQTVLMHSSGQYITSEYPIICKDMTDPQKFGGAVSYARRYALQAIVGITGDKDDDGNLASQPGKNPPQKAETQEKIGPDLARSLIALVPIPELDNIKNGIYRAFNINRIEDIPKNQFQRVCDGLRKKFEDKEEVAIDGDTVELNP